MSLTASFADAILAVPDVCSCLQQQTLAPETLFSKDNELLSIIIADCSALDHNSSHTLKSRTQTNLKSGNETSLSSLNQLQYCHKKSRSSKMGNQITAIAPAQILPLESYFSDQTDYSKPVR